MGPHRIYGRDYIQSSAAIINTIGSNLPRPAVGLKPHRNSILIKGQQLHIIS